MKQLFYLICFFTLFMPQGCSSGADCHSDITLFESNAFHPYAIRHEGMYYLLLETSNNGVIEMWASPTIEDINNGEHKVLNDLPHSISRSIYSPELHRLHDKWYIYFEADDGTNTDTHQLYVLENPSDDPLKGGWTLHGPIITNSEWNFGLHPTTFMHRGRQYLLWSGWPTRRVESETQCIYIAEMENPWTLRSERVMISSPDYEWERQWINPDGTRSAYPIFVNENPEVILSPDGRKVIVAYSASGIWTVFNTIGLVHADADADLLNPASWSKEPEPFFQLNDGSGTYAVSNITVVESDDPDRPWVIYQGRVEDHENSHHVVKARRMEWSDKSLPLFIPSDRR